MIQNYLLDVVTGVLQGDTLLPFRFIIYLDQRMMNLNRSNEKKYFHTVGLHKL